MFLTASKREALPKQDFAGPGRSYPVEDPTHAKLAKAMASRAANAGRMSKGQEGHIDAKADRELGGRGC